MARGHKCVTVRERLWIRFQAEEIKLLIISILCSGNAKRDLVFRHLTPNASRIWWKLASGAS